MTNIIELLAILNAIAFIFFIFFGQGFSAGYLSCNRICFKPIGI